MHLRPGGSLEEWGCGLLRLQVNAAGTWSVSLADRPELGQRMELIRMDEISGLLNGIRNPRSVMNCENCAVKSLTSL